MPTTASTSPMHPAHQAGSSSRDREQKRSTDAAHRQLGLALGLALSCWLLGGCRSLQETPPADATFSDVDAPPGSAESPAATAAERARRAEQFFARGDFEPALALYRSVLDDDSWPEQPTPQRAEVLLRTIVLLLQPGRDTGDWQLAKQYLERLSELAPPSTTTVASASASPTGHAETDATEPTEATDALVRQHRLTANLILRLQDDLERQYRRLEQLKQIDLEASQPPARSASPPPLH